MSKAPTYRPIPWFPGYRVGDDGSVWGCIKLVSRGIGRGTRSVITDNWHRIGPSLDKAGRPGVTLRRSGRSFKRRACRLVLEAFVGPRPAGKEACHFPDRDPANNQLGNLRWGTPKENQADSVTHGTKRRGDRHPMAKLTEADVKAILRRRESGDRLKAIADDYGLSWKYVSGLCNGRNWKHVADGGSE